MGEIHKRNTSTSSRRSTYILVENALYPYGNLYNRWMGKC